MISAFGVDHGEISKGLGQALSFRAGNAKLQFGVLREARAVRQAGAAKIKQVGASPRRANIIGRRADRQAARVVRRGRRQLQRRHQNYISANPPKWMNQGN